MCLKAWKAPLTTKVSTTLVLIQHLRTVILWWEEEDKKTRGRKDSIKKVIDEKIGGRIEKEVKIGGGLRETKEVGQKSGCKMRKRKEEDS